MTKVHHKVSLKPWRFTKTCFRLTVWKFPCLIEHIITNNNTCIIKPVSIRPAFSTCSVKIPWITRTFRSSRLEVFRRKGILRNFAKFTAKHLCQRHSFNEESLAQVFSCQFYEISKNTCFNRTPPVAAFEHLMHEYQLHNMNKIYLNTNTRIIIKT